MSTSRRTLIIIIHYGESDEVLKSLKSMDQEQWPLGDVLIVDNGPGESCAETIHSRYPDVQVKYPGTNLGFSGGCNAGLVAGLAQDYEFFFIINNDVQMQESVVEKMEAAFDVDSLIGLAGPITFWDDGPLFAGATVNWKRGRNRIHWEDWPYEGNEPYDVDVVSGCAFMFRREALEKMALFDDRYFLYWEDVDMCFRVREAGYRTVMVPKTRMFHALSATTGLGSPLITYYDGRNRLVFFQTHAPDWLTRVRVIAHSSISRSLKGLRRLLRGDRAQGIAYIAGVLDYHRGKLGQTDRYKH